MSSRRRYSAEEKAAAVRMVVDSGRTSAAIARELGLNARSLAAWVRADWIARRGQDWSERVRRHFDFLTEHGFTVTDVQAADWWHVSVIYRSSTAAVRVTFSIEYQRVDLELMRLVDHDLPDYPIFVVDHVPVNMFHADWLLLLRGDPDRVPAEICGLSDQQVEAQLIFWAAALREYGGDFLAGDLDVLDQLERMIRDRARGVQQQVTVWLPETSTEDDAAHAVERAQAATPDGVEIAVRRYARPERPSP
jgi:hypothetical protein